MLLTWQYLLNGTNCTMSLVRPLLNKTQSEYLTFIVLLVVVAQYNLHSMSIVVKIYLKIRHSSVKN